MRRMYGIFTYIYHTFKANVTKYTIHGAYGICGYPSQFDIIRHAKFFESDPFLFAPYISDTPGDWNIMNGMLQHNHLINVSIDL